MGKLHDQRSGFAFDHGQRADRRAVRRPLHMHAGLSGGSHPGSKVARGPRRGQSPRRVAAARSDAAEALPLDSSMTSPQSLVVRTFTDRAEGLSHFVLRAGEAPRLLAFDDALGCPVETALAALEWTGAVGILLDDDLLHAARLTSETAAAVIERKGPDGRRFVYLGPRLDAPPMDVFEGAVLFDEPGVKAVEFTQRAHALAHFLRATAGAGRPAGPAGPARARAAAPAPLAGSHHPGAGRAAAAGGRLVRRQLRRLPVRLLRNPSRPTATSRSGSSPDRCFGNVKCGFTSPHRVDGAGRVRADGG